MLHTGGRRRQRIPARDAHEAARIVALASEARCHLRLGKRRPYRAALRQLEALAAPLGYRVVANGDLLGMVVGLEHPERPGPRNWIFLS